MNRNSLSNRRSNWGFEQLEDRLCLSVSVDLTHGGDLVIKGSSSDDEVDVFIAPNGDYTVDTHPGIHTGHGVRDDVRINLGNGNNTLRLAGDVPDDLRIRYGNGDGKVYIGRVGEHDSVTIGDDLTIRLGRGDHLVAIADGNNDADGDVYIRDRFKLDAQKSYHSKVNENKIHIGVEDRVAQIGGSLTIKTDDGRENIRIGEDDGKTIIEGRLRIKTGDHGDKINIADEGTVICDGNAYIHTGAGSDDVDIADDNSSGGAFARFKKNLHIRLGQGNDRLEISSDDDENQTIIEGRLVIKGGRGNDSVELGGDDPDVDSPNAGSLQVDKSLRVNLGKGNDTLRIANEGGRVDVGRILRAKAGDGHDTLITDGHFDASHTNIDDF